MQKNTLHRQGSICTFGPNTLEWKDNNGLVYTVNVNTDACGSETEFS